MANTSIVTNVVSNDFFIRYNDMDLIYVKGLVSKHTKKYADRIKRANDKAVDESASLFDMGAFKQVNMEFDKLELVEEVKEEPVQIVEEIIEENVVPEVVEGPSRIRVLSSEPAKDRMVNTTGTKRPIMNEQVISNALNRNDDFRFETVSVEEPYTLSLGRAA